MGTGRCSETDCFTASEQLFFDFRINPTPAGGEGVRPRRQLKTRVQIFFETA